MIYMIIAGYFEDDASDELTNDPVFKAVLNKDALVSQPTVSRFFNRMDEDTLNQFLTIGRILRKRVYSIQMPQAVILDLDSTLFDAYGKQEGSAFNFHYQSNGYHPLVCYDGLTEDLIKIQLRDGTQYSCTGVVDFLQPILDEYLNDYPAIRILLRGDSGFATPNLVLPDGSDLIISVVSYFLHFFFHFIRYINQSKSIKHSINVGDAPDISKSLWPFNYFSCLLYIMKCQPHRTPGQTFTFFPAVNPKFFCIFTISSFSHFIGERQTGICFKRYILITEDHIP